MRKSNDMKKLRKQIPEFEEAQTGFEPVNRGVADLCLTTWLLRRTLYYIIIFSEKCKHFSKMTPTGIEPVLPP